MMNKSKIPVPSKKLTVSLIPKAVKGKKNISEKENKSPIKLSTKLQVSSLKPNHLVTKPFAASNSIPKIVAKKASKEVPSNHQKIRNLSSCLKVKLIKEEKPPPKVQVASQKSLKNSIKPGSTNVVKRLPNSNNILNLKNTNKKECLPRTLSKTKSAAQKPQYIRDPSCSKKSYPTDKVYRIGVKENIKNKGNSPVRLKEAESNLDKNDIEFQASGFYKKLILDERELSPGIIKLCASKNFSSIVARIDSPEKILQVKDASADRLVEDFKRNSATFRRMRGKLHFSPYLAHKESLFKRTPDLLFSVRRESELKEKFLEKNNNLGISNQHFRRWTANTPQDFEATANEERRFSEMRKESGFPISNKFLSQASHQQLKDLNPHERVLRELNVLTLKKKFKSKKKVTFDIPKTSLSNVKISKKIQSSSLENGLPTVFESSSKNSTPELNSNLCKHSTESLKLENSENSPEVLTPELHLNSLQTNANLFSMGKECDNKQKRETEITTPEFDLKSTCCLNENTLQNSQYCTSKDSISCALLDAQFNKLQISSHISDTKNVITHNVSPKILCSVSETVKKPCISPSKDTAYMPTACLMQSMEKIAVTSLQQQVNYPKEYYANSRKQILTPRPIPLYLDSKVSSNISPLFLHGKSADICSCVPIYTPYVLQNLAENGENSLNSVRQKLQFRDDSEISNERRESQIYIQSIPTLQKTYDYLCDQECSIFASQSSPMEFTRNLKDPVASILSEGDQMHFLPLRL